MKNKLFIWSGSAILSILLLGFITLGITLIYKNKLNKTNAPTVVVNSNSIFVFDLHGVVFNLDLVKVIKIVLKCPHKKLLLKTLLYPRILASTLYSLRKGAIAEEILLKLAKDFPKFKELLPTGFEIINAQKPINDTVELLKALKNNGHQLYVLSNIGEQSIGMLQQQFPDIFALFSGLVASNSHDGYIKKPHALAYAKYLNTFNHKRSEIIFIDDRLKNIVAAQNLGIPALLFINAHGIRKTIGI